MNVGVPPTLTKSGKREPPNTYTFPPASAVAVECLGTGTEVWVVQVLAAGAYSCTVSRMFEAL